jgi:hypothetical protein
MIQSILGCEGTGSGEQDIASAATAPIAVATIQNATGAEANNFIPATGPMMSARAHVSPATPM